MNRKLVTLAAVALFGASLAATPVLAASGDIVSNTATLEYEVGGTPQPPETSNTVDFKVDKKIDLLVAEADGAAVQVVPGSTNRYLTFTVTNQGNDPQDIGLAALALGTNTANPFGGTFLDNFDASLVGVFVETAGGAGYQSGQDTATYIDELAPGASATVYIVVDIDLAQVDEDLAVYALVATALEGGSAGSQGGALTASAVQGEDTVETVFADDAGTDDGPARDAKHSDRSAFLVATATMTVDKSQSIDDGLGGGFAIPGATVTYSMDIDNAGTATASGIKLVDPIPANTKLKVGSGTGGSGYEYTTDAPPFGVATDWTYIPAADVQGADAAVTGIRISVADIAGGASATVGFSVIIK